MDPYQGHVVKNLFVKDKKAKQLWLITVRHDLEFKLTSLGNVSFMFSKNHDLERPISGKYPNLPKKDIWLAKHLKVKDFRMADEQQMIDLLGVERGCATPMALMNDKEKSGEFGAY